MNVKSLLFRSMLTVAMAIGAVAAVEGAASAYPSQCPSSHYCYTGLLQFPEVGNKAYISWHRHDNTGHNFTIDQIRVEHTNCSWAWDVFTPQNSFAAGGGSYACGPVHNVGLSFPDTYYVTVFLATGTANGELAHSLTIGDFGDNNDFHDCGMTPCNIGALS
jgi:hypothetical protein